MKNHTCHKMTKHEFPPTQDACCIYCHVPAHAVLRFDIKCSGPQTSGERANDN